jgi:hypothetical protein
VNMVAVAGYYFVPEWGQREICSCRCIMNDHDSDQCCFEFTTWWCDQVICVECYRMLGGFPRARDAIAPSLVEVIFDSEID